MSTIDAFNDRLRGADQWVFAGGLAAASTSQLIDHQSNAGLITNQSLFSGAEHYSGFSLVRAADLKEAQQLALEGSKACYRRVELRPLLE